MTLARVALALAFFVGPACVIAYEVPPGGTSSTGSSGDPSSSSSDATTSSGSESTATDTDLACVDAEIVCGSTCADLQVDPDHCGECDVVCAPVEACDRAECRESCRDDKEICNRYCVDLDVDPLHCGGCDAPCGPDEDCVQGMCQSGSGT